MFKKIILTLLLFATLSVAISAQCRNYIKAVAPGALDPYIMDGNFFAPVLYEGDSYELSRTFLSKQKYKISVIGMDLFEKKITIKDEDGFIVFKNYLIKKKENPTYFVDIEGNNIDCIGSSYWEFELERSQNLTVTVELERKAKKKKHRLKGCLGVVIGFENK